jgi:hypothetical protein
MIYLLLLPLILYAAMAFFGFLYALRHVPSATHTAFGSTSLGIELAIYWFLLFWLGLVVEAAGLLIAPVVILFADHRTGLLPKPFAWMETPDASLPGYPANQGFDMPVLGGWWSWYWRSLCWLSRNRVYRFSAETMGIYCFAGQVHALYGDPTISDSAPIRLGKYVDVAHDCFECESIFMLAGRCWALRVGYKMRNVRDRSGYAQHVMRILPLRK